MYKYECTDTERSAVSKSFNRTMWAISGGFFAVAVLFTVSFYFVSYHGYRLEENALAVILIPAAIYTVSGIIIMRYIKITLLKLIFCQSGGFINVIAIIVALNALTFEMTNYYAFKSDFFILDFTEVILELFGGYSMCFAVYCLPALEISFLIQAVIGLIMKKVRSSKTAAVENIEVTDNEDAH